MQGLIFSVRRYSIHDGPGIRVTFFMKGCPLSCLWCHNPEGISPFPESVPEKRKVGKLEFVEEREVGKYYTVENVLEELEKDRTFIDQSKGGVTFSGGEPMMQFEFLLAALKACKENGYHTAVDTSGYSSTEKFRALIPFTDLFLFDIKHLDEESHLKLTGVSNTVILNNYLFLLENGRNVLLRLPVIPGVNDSSDYLEELRQFILTTKTKSLKKISLLPFHKLGSSKYLKFGVNYNMGNVKTPSKERMSELKDFFSQNGIRVKIGG